MRPGEAAAGEDQSVCADDLPQGVVDRPVILDAVAVPHLLTRAPIRVRGGLGNVDVAIGTLGFAVVRFEAADGRLPGPGPRRDSARSQEHLELAGEPVSRRWIGEIDRAALSFPPSYHQWRAALGRTHEEAVLLTV